MAAFRLFDRVFIAYSFFFTGAETEKDKIKDNSKIIRQTYLDGRGLRPIPIMCHLLDPPSFSLPTTFKEVNNENGGGQECGKCWL